MITTISNAPSQFVNTDIFANKIGLNRNKY